MAPDFSNRHLLQEVAHLASLLNAVTLATCKCPSNPKQRAAYCNGFESFISSMLNLIIYQHCESHPKQPFHVFSRPLTMHKTEEDRRQGWKAAYKIPE
jgi:hypothetical protein